MDGGNIGEVKRGNTEEKLTGGRGMREWRKNEVRDEYGVDEKKY